MRVHMTGAENKRRSMWRSLIKNSGSLFGFSSTRPAFMDRTDAEALASDWKAVGDDMRSAMRQHGKIAPPEPWPDPPEKDQ